MSTSAHEPYDELCFSVYTTNRYFHRLYSQLLQQYDLTYLQYMVLLAVKNEKQTTLTTICLKLDLANNTLTPVIKKLVAKKWLIKERSAKDSRCLVISLNKASLKTLEEIREKVGYVQHLFSQLTELPIDQLIKQHMTLNANLLELNQKMDSEDS